MGDALSGRSVESVAVLVNANAAIGRFSRYCLTSPHPDGANHLVLKLRLPRAGKLALRLGVLNREGQTGKQRQQSSYESWHGPTVANRRPFAEIQPAGTVCDWKVCVAVTYVSETLPEMSSTEIRTANPPSAVTRGRYPRSFSAFCADPDAVWAMTMEA